MLRVKTKNWSRLTTAFITRLRFKAAKSEEKGKVTYLGTEGTLSGRDGTPGMGRDGRDGGVGLG